MNERLGLGTVQFGLPYGIANRSGQPSLDEVRAVLACARSAGLKLLDTAVAYGDSERRLGKIGVHDWQIVSKLSSVPSACRNFSAWVEQSVSESLDRLRIESLYGLLLHDPNQLLGDNGEQLYRALASLKDRRHVGRIGVSVYGPDELDALIPRFDIDLVQAPFNVVDRRLATSGWLQKLHKAGIEVHVRSVFLQGLLLMDAEQRPAQFGAWQPIWDAWHAWLDERELKPVQACLGFAMALPEIDRVIVGVDTVPQLKEILDGLRRPVVNPPQSVASEDLNLVNPSHWNGS